MGSYFVYFFVQVSSFSNKLTIGMKTFRFILGDFFYAPNGKCMRETTKWPPVLV